MKDAQIELMGDITELILLTKCLLIDSPGDIALEMNLKNLYHTLWNAYDEGL